MAQDTLTVYFQEADYHLPESEIRKLTHRFSDVTSSIDSVYFLGFADSIGTARANYRLSQKRAKETESVLKNFMKSTVSSRVFSNGESFGHKNNRRVDILVFSHQEQQPFLLQDSALQKQKTTEPLQNNNKPKVIKYCYATDYDILQNAHTTHVTVAGKKYTRVEIPSKALQRKSKTEHFFFDTQQNKVVGFKWKRKTTGKAWWSTSRYIALLPEQNTASVKLFKRQPAPCSDCATDKPTLQNSATQKQVMVDRFLMDNMQLKPRLWQRNKIAVRVPREYANLNVDYFIGCDTTKAIRWKTKKRDNNYYYTTLGVQRKGIDNISRYMPYCPATASKPDCNKYYTKLKGYKATYKGLQIVGRAAWKNKNHILSTFIGGGISKEWERFRSDFLFGVNTDKEKQLKLQAQYFLFLFPVSNKGVFPTWKKVNRVRMLNFYGRCYIGTTAYYSFPKLEENQALQEIHFGLSVVNTDEKAVLPTIYAQVATGFNYSTSKGTGACLELGTIIRFWNLPFFDK